MRSCGSGALRGDRGGWGDHPGGQPGGLSRPANLIVAGVTLVPGTSDFTLRFGAIALGGIGTATFAAILLHALLGRGDGAAAR